MLEWLMHLESAKNRWFMAKKLKAERDRLQKGSIAEEFVPTNENKFIPPGLVAMYWKNPNSQKGVISTCSYMTNGFNSEIISTTGV